MFDFIPKEKKVVKQRVKLGELKKALASFEDDLAFRVYSESGETSKGDVHLVIENDEDIVGWVDLESGHVTVKT